MPDIERLAASAQQLGALHRIGRPLLLVNVWDAAGARAVVAAGSPAVATSSVAMAAARAGSDGNRDREAAFVQLRQITSAVDVPVTADLEGGYDLAPEELVDALLGAGAVGCNIEDTDHATGDGLLDAETRAGYLAGVRAAADGRGVHIVLNARVDAIIRHPQRDPAAAMDEVLRRARLYLDAGADCVYRSACETRRWWLGLSRSSTARLTSTRRTRSARSLKPEPPASPSVVVSTAG